MLKVKWEPGFSLPAPVPGDPAPAQECVRLVLRCLSCGVTSARWRPARYAWDFGLTVIVNDLACRKCDGPVVPEVGGYEFRVPEGPVVAGEQL